MEVRFLNNMPGKDDRPYIYYLNKEELGPFSLPSDDIKEFVKSVSEFKLDYRLKTYIPSSQLSNLECFYWKITQNYNFDQRAHFVLRLNIEKNYCKEQDSFERNSKLETFINKLYWIHVIVFFLALASFILTWKYIFRIGKLYWRIKNQLENQPAVNYNEMNNNNNQENNENNKTSFNKNQSTNYIEGKTKWDQLSLKEKGKFFNKWSIICLAGNIIQIFGSLLYLIQSVNIETSSELLIGFGCMFAYINIGRYLDYNKDYSTIYMTISRALPNVIRYFLGVLPIFFGFIFFGLCLFWKSERFTSISSTMMTLFAVLNGDSVFDVFNDLAGVDFVLGQIYCYVFCIVFIV